MLAGQDKCRLVKLSTGGKCAASGSTCDVASTTVQATASVGTAPAYTSIKSVPAYSSAGSVSAFPSSAIIAYPSVGVQVSSMESYSASESVVPSLTLPAYETISETTVAVSSSIEIPTSSAQLGSAAPTAYSSLPTLPAYSSEFQATTPAYSAPVESTVIASTYSAPMSTPIAYTAPAESKAITSIYSAPMSTSTASSSFAYSVPTYNASSASVSSSWTTFASTSTATSIATTSSIATAPAYSEATSTVAATSTTASVCQTALTGAYQTPHLIVPISSSSPDTVYGTQYNAYIDSDNSTIFNFDIPSSYEGMTCTTIFLFPEIADLETSSYTFSGSGDLVFSELSSAATEETTYNSAPSVTSVLDTVAIQSGNSYVIASGSCAAGTTVAIELSSQSGLSLEFFEDWK